MDAVQSSATGAMEEDIAATSTDGPGYGWHALERVFSELALADMASKAQLLQSLSSFLSCVAKTMSFSTEFYTLSAWVGASTVLLGRKEVAQLHELVIRELKDQTYFLSELSNVNKKIDEGADGNFTRVLNLEIVSQTLRCCIRILPLMDCFDKSASLASTKLLDGILQQLCHPTKLFHLLRLKTSEDEHTRRNCQKAQGDEDGSCHQTKEPPEACTTNGLDLESQHRIELVFAILEVYVDELVLRPELTARLLMSRESMCRSLAPEQVTCFVKHTEASLEAAFVHVLLFLHSGASLRSRNGFPVCNLSLPAGLLLLEKFSEEEVPPFYIAHVVRLLGRMLNDTTALGFGQVEDLRRARPNVLKSFRVGGVDWSYCSEELLPNCDFKDKYFFTKLSQSETTLNFASSILEHAILQYRKISLASDACSDGSGPFRFQTVEKSLLVFYLSKYSPLCSVFGETPKLNMANAPSGSGDIGAGHVTFYRDYFQCSFSGVLNTESELPLEYGSDASGLFMRQGAASGYYSFSRRNGVVIEKEDSKDTAGSVVALLQLMSSALKCIVREVSMSTWLPDSIENQFLNDARAMPSSESNTADFDNILLCVGLYLSLCFPSTTGHFSMYHEQQCERAGEGEGAQGTLNKFVGQAIVFFTNVLRGEVRRAVPDEVLEEYFHLVESLVALLTALHVRNDRRKSAAECALIGNGLFDDICRTSLEISTCETWGNCSPSQQQLPNSDNVSSYLNEMVLSLQGMLRDLSEQQRSMPEFFLSFVFKQLSKHDSLSLVAQAFSSCLHSHLGDFQTVIRKIKVFRSDGLVTEVVHLALSEPTRPFSLHTFIVYIVDILQDHSPITTALSLSEITELISWFETIAYSLTLASQLIVCEERMFVRNGKDRFISLISKMSKGIDRILSEGTATAHWLAHLSKAMSKEAWHKVDTILGCQMSSWESLE